MRAAFGNFAVRRSAVARGVELAVVRVGEDVATAWSWRGQIHLDGHDPEGNPMQYRAVEAQGVPQDYPDSPTGHNHAAPRTPLESPCTLRTTRVRTRSENT